MTLTPMNCIICKQPLVRALIELGWNDGMNATELASAVHGDISAARVMRHLKEHSDEAHSRNIPVVITPMRERVYDIQRLQVDEIERRVRSAQQRAAFHNEFNKNVEGFEPHDWSHYFDILSKDMQAAVSSIIKTQGLADKRDKAQGDLKIGLFEAMANAGLAPKSLIGGRDDVPLQLDVPQDVEHG